MNAKQRRREERGSAKLREGLKEVIKGLISEVKTGKITVEDLEELIEGIEDEE